MYKKFFLSSKLIRLCEPFRIQKQKLNGYNKDRAHAGGP